MQRYFLFFMSVFISFSCKNQDSEQATQSSSDTASQVASKDASIVEQQSLDESVVLGAEGGEARALPPEGVAKYTVSSLSVEWGDATGKESYIHTDWERGDYVAYHVCPHGEGVDESLCQSAKSFHRSFAIGLIPDGKLFVQAWVCVENTQAVSVCGPALSKSFSVPEVGLITKRNLFQQKQTLMTRLHDLGLSLKESLAELETYQDHCEFSEEQKQILSELLSLPSGVIAESVAKENLEEPESAPLQLQLFTKIDGNIKNDGRKETVRQEASRVDYEPSPPGEGGQGSSIKKSDVTRWSKVKKWIQAHREESILLLGGLAVTVAILRLTSQKDKQADVLDKKFESSSVCHRTSGLFLQVDSVLKAIKGLSSELEWVQTQIEE